LQIAEHNPDNSNKEIEISHKAFFHLHTILGKLQDDFNKIAAVITIGIGSNSTCYDVSFLFQVNNDMFLSEFLRRTQYIREKRNDSSNKTNCS